ncbi:amino acid adenylation domain-containing protein [Kitasatospora sp. NPDC058162]|uniref:amino acid adenylation domain-containing protein n=1 Tax=Kitasatospora sp. NPDC058162 TaxID=3346362 RepID=UPI0036D770E0
MKPVRLPAPDADHPSLVSVLRGRAREHPDRVAYTFLTDDGVEQRSLDHAALDRAARTIGHALQRLDAEGQRAILLYPPGLDYLAAYFGCLYAGTVAVPAYPPDPTRLERSLPRLLAVLEDARPVAVLTVAALADAVPALLSSVPRLSGLTVVATDALAPEGADAWRDPEVTADTTAMLQYTSGSTADPRGVVLTHGNLLRNSAVIRADFGVDADSRGVIWLPPYHDMGLIGGILQPLYTGFPVTLMSPVAFLKRPLTWLEALSRTGGTVSGGPNFAYELCVRKTTPEQRAALDLSRWRVAFNGAEPIRAETLRRFADAFAVAGFRPEAFHPCYGLAEATLMVTGGVPWSGTTGRFFDRTALRAGTALARPDGPASGGPTAGPNDDPVELVSCGRVAPGHRVAVVDPDTALPVGPGGIGELWLSGPSLAGGYWGDPDRAGEVFGRRLPGEDTDYLRTGDLGFLHEGELYVTGRIKDVIIVRGQNHYPHDLELTAEDGCPHLRPGCGAAFTVRHPDGADPRLVLAHEVRDPGAADAARIGAAVRAAVARDHSVTVHTVVLVPPGGLPKTSSGKIQRAACAAQFAAGTLPEVGRSELDAAGPAVADRVDPDALRAAAPQVRRRALEDFLRQEVATACGLAPAAVDTSAPLLSLGVDSLAVVDIQQAIGQRLGVPVTVPQLADAGSLTQLAALLGSLLAGEAGDAGAEPVDGPLSYGQRALWFLQQLEPDSTAHHITAALRLHGPFDPDAFRRALDALVARHDALRTTFPAPDGQPVQRTGPADRTELRVHDAAGRSEADLTALLDRAADEPFDLAHGPLLRIDLFRLAPQETVLLLATHHITTDFWSMSKLVADLEALYTEHTGGPAAALEPLPATYRDFVARQHRTVEGAAGERSRRYWAEELADASPRLRLPRHHRPADAERPGPGTVRARLAPELTARLRARAGAEGVTVSMLLLSAYQALLHRYTGQDDLLVGMPTAGRAHQDFEHVVGYCTNPVVIRSRLAADTSVREFVAATRTRVLNALEHQEHPLHLLAEDQRQRDPFRAMFVFNRPPLRGRGELAVLMAGHTGIRRAFGPLTAEAVPLDRTRTPVDLELTVVEAGDELLTQLRHRTEVLGAGTATALLEQLERLLGQIAADPALSVGGLRLLDEPGERALLAGHGTRRDYDLGTNAVQLFERQVELRPDALAVLGDEGEVSYAQLNARADTVARQLRARGVDGRSLVGILLDRSPAQIAAVLGVLKAGAAYVPVDAANPRERVAEVLTGAGVRVVLSQHRLAPRLPQGVDAVLVDGEQPPLDPADPAGPHPAAGPDDLAYLIHTSGSTGAPKAVQIEHRGLTNYTRFAVEHFGLRPGDRVLQFASLAFDTSAEEIFPTLAAGATLVLRNDWMLSSPDAFLRQCDRWRVSVLDLPTAYWHELADGVAGGAAAPGGDLRLVIIGGERARPERVDAWLRHVPAGVRTVNSYGPTETTIVATVQDLIRPAGEGDVPIGRPVANVRAYVLDPAGRPVPAGAVGELYVAGPGVARGYLGHPELTEERFRPDPFTEDDRGARMYRTGDLASWAPDGTLTFVGRADRQLKLNGYRVEPAEIEALLLAADPAVAEALVLPHPDGNRLIAYLTGVAGAAPDPDRLRAALRDRLPGYLVPAAVTVLPSFPRSASGKVDRGQLPPPQTRTGEGTAPRTPTEQALAGIVAEVLGLTAIGVHDDFFTHGGHSLLATKVIARVRDHFGTDLPLRAFFEHPTVAELAEQIPTGPLDTRRPAQLPIPRVSRDRPLPLSFVQERIWLLQRLAPESTVYNVPRALRIRGEFDRDVVEQVLADLEQRHEILHTAYPDIDGTPMQVVHEPRGIPLGGVDLEGLPEAEQEERVRELILAAGREPFDIEHGPTIRVTLVRLGPADHVLVVIEHHLIHDGWAQGVFLRDFLELYEVRTSGRAARLPELPVQFADFAAWQREVVSGAELDRLLDFWTTELDGAPQVLELPTDRPHEAALTFSGRLENLVIDGELALALRRVGQERRATLFMMMATAFSALMSHYSGQPDLLVGVGMANRTRPETENLLGMMINTLLLRVDTTDDPTFAELLERVRERSLRMYAHQDMPFEKLVEHLKPERSLSRMPLCQVMFSFLDTPMPALEVPGLTFEVVDAHNRTAKFDFNIVVRPHAEQRPGEVSAEEDSRITVMTEYNSDVFDLRTVQRLHRHLRAVLELAVTDPDRPLSAALAGALLVDPADRADTDDTDDTGDAVSAVPGLPAPEALTGPGLDLDLDLDLGFEDDEDDEDGDWETEYVAPRTPLEQRLTDVWAEYLPVERVGVNDDFFDLGGHSLLANQVLARLRREFGVQLPLRRLFEAPTVATLAVLVLEEQAAGVDGPELAAILAELED